MISRRRFLGYSAMQVAAALGLNSISLKSFAATPVKLLQATQPLSSLGRVPIVLVGSGYGNAVTALRLCERGYKVVMLEMGQLWVEPSVDGKIFSPTMNADGRAMWNRTQTKAPVKNFLGIPITTKIDRYAGVLDLIEYGGGMSVYVGRGVGGGSLVNGAMAVTPPRSSFVEAFPMIDANEMYTKYYPMANIKLGANLVDQNWFEKAECYQFSRVSRNQAQQSGYETVFVPSTYDLDYMKKELANQVPRSALAQEVIYGNNAGKRSVDKTYIAEAMGTGNLSIYALQQVYHIEQLPNGDYCLKMRGLDKALNVVSETTLTCGALFLGAGSCGTTELLLRAREKGTLANLSTEVGREWGNNGNIMSARANHIWNPTGALQSTMPLMGINDWNNLTNPVFCEITPLPMGIESWVSMYLAITKTPERGYFKYDAVSDRAILQWTDSQNDYARNSAKMFFDKINWRQGTIYRYDLFGKGTPWGDDFCYHPLGGCVLGKATDNYGRLKGYSRLYVTDSSLIPGLIGVNPFVTITALAERNIKEVLNKDNLE